MQGKVALVTGASRGIGRAIALRFAQEGANVGINYRTSREEAEGVAQSVRELGVEPKLLHADVSRPDQVQAMFQALDVWGGVDILVNNAGVTRDGLLMRMSEDDWDEVMNVNLRGAFLCCRAAARPMVRKRWGRIINMASVVGLAGNPGQSNYAASKAGLIGLTRTLSRELASRNITVNAIAPGFIETDMVASLSEEARNHIRSRIPMDGFGTPEDVAAAAAFLASDGARYITGQTIGVDGGIAL
ncbi:MAG: 3-oxoacyl-[acyl-carrier-protein] reductase [Chloroflexi bacterium]|nr:3-oxoacyl-[acyl-carrier-protein] reductase [Chloroflexota bacterium]